MSWRMIITKRRHTDSVTSMIESIVYGYTLNNVAQRTIVSQACKTIYTIPISVSTCHCLRRPTSSRCRVHRRRPFTSTPEPTLAATAASTRMIRSVRHLSAAATLHDVHHCRPSVVTFIRGLCRKSPLFDQTQRRVSSPGHHRRDCRHCVPLAVSLLRRDESFLRSLLATRMNSWIWKSYPRRNRLRSSSTPASTSYSVSTSRRFARTFDQLLRISSRKPRRPICRPRYRTFCKGLITSWTNGRESVEALATKP